MARRHLEPEDGRPVLGDVLGVLTAWEDGVLTVVGRDGRSVQVAEEALVAAKRVPPAPVRRRAPEQAPGELPGPVELQRIAAAGWPAVESERLGAWVLRASAGFTRRANSVQALGDPGLPLADALAVVRAWYAARGLPAYVEVTEPGSPEELRAELARGGAEEAPTLFRTAPLAALAAPAAGDVSGRVRLARTAGQEWRARYRRAGDDPELERAAHAVLHGGRSVWFATVPSNGAVPSAIGRCVVDGAWAGFSAVEVDPELRRQGLARSVMAALAARAAEEGAEHAYLQVEAENAPAIALYDRLGFTTRHTYLYSRLPR